ncbi:LOW QUALITY PROTEIN: protein PEAK3 [Molossus nigricans]
MGCPSPEPRGPTCGPWSCRPRSLPLHFNLQGLCGLVPEGALPERCPIVTCSAGSRHTWVQWQVEVGAQRPADFTALALLQLSTALEHLETWLGGLFFVLLSLVPLAKDLEPRAAQLAHVPSATLICCALQVLLWEPEPELHSRRAPLGPG